MGKRLLIAQPTGFCGGVRHAIDMFRKIVAESPGEKVYVFHELVHNRRVTEAMGAMGAVFVEEVASVPPKSIILLGAHGCGEGVEAECRARGLRVFDATCPLVKQLQRRVVESAPELPIVFLGDRRHPEVMGVLDRLHGRRVYPIADEAEASALPRLPEAFFFSQTTRCITEIQRTREALQERVASLRDYAHACDAVFRRQKAMEQVARQSQRVYVIGSPHSSNARRLTEIARENCGGEVLLVESVQALSAEEMQGVEVVGLGTATSTPDEVLCRVVEFFRNIGFSEEETEYHEH